MVRGAISFYPISFLYRRTNSDSALHQSTLTPVQQASFTGGSQELQPKRGTRHLLEFRREETTLPLKRVLAVHCTLCWDASERSCRRTRIQSSKPNADQICPSESVHVQPGQVFLLSDAVTVTCWDVPLRFVVTVCQRISMWEGRFSFQKQFYWICINLYGDDMFGFVTVFIVLYLLFYPFLTSTILSLMGTCRLWLSSVDPKTVFSVSSSSSDCTRVRSN